MCETEEDLIIKCEIQLDRIFFPKSTYFVESGNYAIFLAKLVNVITNEKYLNDKNFIKLKGNVCKLESCTTYTVMCKVCEKHPQYGDTFEIVFMNKKIDLTDKTKQMNFLSSIINPNIVNKLFEKYENVIELLETKNFKELTSISGVGYTTATKMIQEYEDSKDYSTIYAELSDLKLTSTFIKKLVDFYKSPTTIVDIIKNNPYKLIEVSGIGFDKADEIAQKIGIVDNDPRRVKAYIIHTLTQNGEVGKSFIHYSELISNMYKTIGFIEENVQNNVAEELMETKKIFVSNEGQYIGLNRYYKLELNIAMHLLRLKYATREESFNLNKWEDKIKEIEEQQGYEFTEEQKNTIRMSIEHNVLLITGSGGTGKTTLLNAICKIFEKYYIGAVALSGKAAVRIFEATGVASSTIHKLLGYSFGEFIYNRRNPLGIDLLIIDESTMVNGDLFLSLLEALKSGTKLIMVGDHQQLTPIGNCQVFTDVLNSDEIIAVSRLTQLHRQAQLSGIIPTSILTINQEQIFKSSFAGNIVLGELRDMELDIFKSDVDLSDRVVEHFIKHYNISKNIIETQVIVPMRTRGNLSTYNLNLKIQEVVNPVNKGDIFIEVEIKNDKKYKIKIGDKVINTKNNYKSVDTKDVITPIFNGNVGIVKELSNKLVTVDFIGIGEIILNEKGIKNLELAYASTTHKCQGGGYDRVIFAVDSSAFMLLNAELIYTGLTRAKKYCVLVGENSAIRMAINKREVKLKQTYLKYILNESKEASINHTT